MHTEIDICIPLDKKYAVYTKTGEKWDLFSAEPNLYSAKITASMLEVTTPNTSVKIVEPKYKTLWI